jgi:hypothetical protein
MKGRTVILVSHHVQLCAPGAKFIVALDNGRVQFSGDQEHFQSSGVMNTLVQSDNADAMDDKEEAVAQGIAATPEKAVLDTEPNSETSSTVAAFDIKEEKKAPRKLIEEEKRAVGRIGKDIWETYIKACGDVRYWSLFIAALSLAALIPVAENGWLEYASLHVMIRIIDRFPRIWSGSPQKGEGARSPVWYISIYAAVRIFVARHACISEVQPFHQISIIGWFAVERAVA